MNKEARSIQGPHAPKTTLRGYKQFLEFTTGEVVQRIRAKEVVGYGFSKGRNHLSIATNAGTFNVEISPKDFTMMLDRASAYKPEQ